MSLVKLFEEIIKKQHHKDAGDAKEQSTIKENKVEEKQVEEPRQEQPEAQPTAPEKEEPRYESYPEKIEKPKEQVPSIAHLKKLRGL